MHFVVSHHQTVQRLSVSFCLSENIVSIPCILLTSADSEHSWRRRGDVVGVPRGAFAFRGPQNVVCTYLNTIYLSNFRLGVITRRPVLFPIAKGVTPIWTLANWLTAQDGPIMTALSRKRVRQLQSSDSRVVESPRSRVRSIRQQITRTYIKPMSAPRASRAR